MTVTMNATPRVSIVILNWNGWEDTIECIESVHQIKYTNYDIVLVDNASTNESICKIKDYCKGVISLESEFLKCTGTNKPIRVFEYDEGDISNLSGIDNEFCNLSQDRRLILIKNKKNYGFAKGNNIGIEYALKILKPDYILLLNNDTVVDMEFLSELVVAGEKSTHIGILGSKIFYYDFNGKKNILWFAGGKINNWSGKVTHYGNKKEDCMRYNSPGECDIITGCSMLIKARLLNEIGGLDEMFFLYSEDIDFSLRAKTKGWKLFYVPTSKLWHKVSNSTKQGSTFISPTQIYFSTKSKMLLMKKNAKTLNYLIFILYTIVYRHIECVFYSLFVNRDLKVLKSYYLGMYDGYRFKK
jgi:GT2 family glycosyltransferase